MMSMRTLTLAIVAAATLAAQSDYTGPIPPKADVPYLLHASTLVETQVTEAKKESKKGGTLYWIDGASSTARTPLAEPIFIIRTEKLNPAKLELYRFDVNKGRRELTIKDNPGRNDRPLHLAVTKLSKDLYRVEASEQLPNGEYSLSPSESDQVFAFQVY
jgi:hypothetical protein